MTTLDQINNSLKARKPAAKASAATAKTPDVATLRSRIAETRKALNQLLAQAQGLGASGIAEQVRALSARLCQLEGQLASVRGLSTKLVQLINISNA
jgi:hypothetical protein